MSNTGLQKLNQVIEGSKIWSKPLL